MSVHCGDVAGVLVWGSLPLKCGADADGWSGVASALASL